MTEVGLSFGVVFRGSKSHRYSSVTPAGCDSEINRRSFSHRNTGSHLELISSSMFIYRLGSIITRFVLGAFFLSFCLKAACNKPNTLLTNENCFRQVERTVLLGPFLHGDQHPFPAARHLERERR